MKITQNAALIYASLSALCFTTSIHADSNFEINANNFEFSYGISTFGYTITPSYRINDRFGVRVPLGYATTPTTVINDGTQVLAHVLRLPIQTDIPAQHENVDVLATMSGFGLLADYYFNRLNKMHQFRATGGVMIPNYKLEGSGTINDNIFVAGKWIEAESVDVSMWIDNPVPYLGLGYEYGAANGWGISADFGVMFGIGYEGKISGVASNPDDQDALDRGLKDEMDIKLKVLEDYPLLPYISIAAVYRF